jgi:hypothetical protein
MANYLLATCAASATTSTADNSCSKTTACHFASPCPMTRRPPYIKLIKISTHRFVIIFILFIHLFYILF